MQQFSLLTRRVLSAAWNGNINILVNILVNLKCFRSIRFSFRKKKKYLKRFEFEYFIRVLRKMFYVINRIHTFQYTSIIADLEIYRKVSVNLFFFLTCVYACAYLYVFTWLPIQQLCIVCIYIHIFIHTYIV